MNSIVLREIVGVEVHSRKRTEDIRGRQMAAMYENLDFGGDGWIPVHT